MKEKKQADLGLFAEKVYTVVRQIPCGKVASYGQIAWAVDAPRNARQVGWAMSRCPEDIPWQRVVRSDGVIALGGHAEIRRAMLESEGVLFKPDGKIDMKACQWKIDTKKLK